jgi:hypothetical protein
VAKRKTYYAGITACKIFDRVKPGMLDGIGSGFVERIAAGNIGLNFEVRIGAHGHFGAAQVAVGAR